MYETKKFIPKILLRGDKAEFFAQVGQRPFKLVGEINFVDEVDGTQFHFFRDGKFSIDGKLHDYQELPQILRGEVADYIVFADINELVAMQGVLQSIGCPHSQIVSLREFMTMPRDAFYDVDSARQLMQFLKENTVKTLLDVDAHFAKSQLLTKGVNDVTEIDCVCEGEMLPIKENIYSRVYKKFSDCQFRHYDAALVYGREGIDFIAEFSALEGITDTVITFAKYGSDFEKYIGATVNHFERVDFIPSFAGRWFFCHRHKAPKDFAMYVVTHKPLPPEHVENLPAGYKVIHAGRAISHDLGYLGDNTGENVSYLNPYINELTALYWMWKNTSHSIIGLSHYRRFFTESEDVNFSHDKILTQDAAEHLLQKYDIIVNPYSGSYNQHHNIEIGINPEIMKLTETTLKKYLVSNFPDYVEMFDEVMNSRFFYKCAMFVTRKNIFDAYCNWLFSFMIDTCKEFLEKVPYEFLQGKAKRLIGYFGECMWTVWLLKNRLRIKELEIMQVPNL